MQFLEWSVAGLRSARWVYRDVERDLSVTLYPMVHLGEAAFYEAVYADAATHDAVVLEGIGGGVARRLTRSYRWIAPGRLGLVVQPRFDREHGRLIRGDLDPEAFEAIWRAAPRSERWSFEIAATGFGLWQRLKATRASLGRGLCTTDLRDRDTILSWSERNAPMLEALLSERDAALGNAMRGLFQESEGSGTIAVVFGAGHMGALSHLLIGEGFRPVESTWLTVFSP